MGSYNVMPPTTTLVSHNGQVLWGLVQKKHPYLYGLRAFLAGEISEETAIAHILCDTDALAEIETMGGTEGPRDHAVRLVNELWWPAKRKFLRMTEAATRAGWPAVTAWEVTPAGIDWLLGLTEEIGGPYIGDDGNQEEA